MTERRDDHHPVEDDSRPAGEPDPQELRRKGKDPAWPIPGLAGNDPEHDSPASDADAPAP